MNKNGRTEDVLTRLMHVLQVDSWSALARALGTTPQTVSSWRSRDSIPFESVMQVAEDQGVSLDWLLCGRGSMRPSVPMQVNQDQAHYKDGINRAEAGELSPREKIALDLFKSLSDEQQQEVLSDAQEKKRLTDLENQLIELKAAMDSLKKSG